MALQLALTRLFDPFTRNWTVKKYLTELTTAKLGRCGREYRIYSAFRSSWVTGKSLGERHSFSDEGHYVQS